MPRLRTGFAALLVSLLGVLLAVAGCSSTPSRDAGTAPATGDSAGRPAVDRRVEKLLVVVVENHSLDQMRDQMPWVLRLAERYGYTTHYDALTHPSLPNYLAIAGGSTFGVQDDEGPALHPLTGRSVFGAAVANGHTARVYAEDMRENCQGTSAGRYAARHNPWTYFVDERAQCARDDVPLDRLPADIAAGRLPDVGMVVPDLCSDAHDCSLAHADAWLREQLTPVLGGPDWRSGHLAVVITADEDDQHHGNRILTVVAHPALHHAVVGTPLTHYSLSRSYADVVGAPAPGRAAQATPLLGQFGLVAGG